MGVFDDEIQLAKEEIAANGANVLWQSLTDAALPDPNKAWLPGEPTFVDHPVRIVFLPITAGNRQTDKYKFETEVRVGEFKGLMAQVNFTPRAKDFILDGTKKIKVTSVNELAPNGEIILYFLELSI